MSLGWFLSCKFYYVSSGVCVGPRTITYIREKIYIDLRLPTWAYGPASRMTENLWTCLDKRNRTNVWLVLGQWWNLEEIGSGTKNNLDLADSTIGRPPVCATCVKQQIGLEIYGT